MALGEKEKRRVVVLAIAAAVGLLAIGAITLNHSAKGGGTLQAGLLGPPINQQGPQPSPKPNQKPASEIPPPFTGKDPFVGISPPPSPTPTPSPIPSASPASNPAPSPSPSSTGTPVGPSAQIAGHQVTLLSVAGDNQSAAVMVDSDTSTVNLGATFGPNGQYLAVSMVNPCVTVKYQTMYWVLCTSG